jgi:hypothetical protein
MHVISILSLLVYFIAVDKTFSQVILAQKGKQPKAIVDQEGNINVVYGDEDDIYLKKSKDGAKTFTLATKVANLPNGLMLGMGRGPQIAISNTHTLISAVDEKGNILSWRKANKSEKWENPVVINDIDTVAKEGFVALASGNNEYFYAIWNDLRSKNNQIYGAISKDGGKSWGKNRLVYSSPDTTICECCKVSMTFNKQSGKVHVMWRNQLNGHRDMFFVTLDSNLEQQTQPAKLGKGTWKLDGCPMDGGNLTVSPEGKVLTAWRREGKVYINEPGKEEVLVAEGKNPVIGSRNGGNVILWNTKSEVMALLPKSAKPVSIGKGSYPNIVAWNNMIIAFWEDADGKLIAKDLSSR